MDRHLLRLAIAISLDSLLGEWQLPHSALQPQLGAGSLGRRLPSWFVLRYGLYEQVTIKLGCDFIAYRLLCDNCSGTCSSPLIPE